MQTSNIKSYKKLSKEELVKELDILKKEYSNIIAQNLSLDMTRGKPSKEQLDLSNELLTILKTNEDCLDVTGFDTRNYGILSGIKEAKELFSSLMSLTPDRVIIGGNSSLTMMYDTLVRCLLFGVDENSTPWIKQGEIKFLCPCPGYDRHFAMLEDLGFKLIPISLTGHGPDMDTVEKLVECDESIKGIFCVPKYSNPTGEIYSKETLYRLANLSPKAKDFRVFYDNAYIVHDFDSIYELDNIFSLTDGTKNENMVYEFISTSKMSFPGDGIAVLGSSKTNIDFALKHLNYQMISSDKLNQLRQVRFFKNVDGIKSHMKKHGKIMKAKFDCVTKAFECELQGCDIASWTKPNGGYFVGLTCYPHTATKVYNLCLDCGLKLTKVGAAFPYNKDPDDSFLRICPSYVNNDDLSVASHILCLCVKIAALEELI